MTARGGELSENRCEQGSHYEGEKTETTLED